MSQKQQNPYKVGTPIAFLWDVTRMEATAGFCLLIASIFAMWFANTYTHMYEDWFHHTEAGFHIGNFHLEKHLLHWINDGLMAIFFFLVGLEVKREIFSKGGNLSSFDKAIFPIFGAIGGMLLPAVIFFVVNQNHTQALQGVAIPTATDIAFAIGLMALVGSRVPFALKTFLLALAIFDDLGAIAIIAVFYTESIATNYLQLALIPAGGMLLLNLGGVKKASPYLMCGVVLWFFVLNSGIHATLAGVVAALFIPLKQTENSKTSLLESLEKDLFFSVTYLILPIFAFANAGINLEGMTLGLLLEPLTLGIALGLLIGKQVGIVGFCYLYALLTNGGRLTLNGVTWRHMWGMSCFAGVGFTMSLFIGGLSFSDPTLLAEAKAGIMTGSLLSALMGFAIFQLCPKTEKEEKLQSAQPAE